jgi:hypothetical protein
MAIKNKVREKAGTARASGPTRDRDMLEWRGSVTEILSQQTEILRGLREDFKKHEDAEEVYQSVVTNFMSNAKTDTAILREQYGEQDRIIERLSSNHESAMKLIREINNKVWLITGAVIIYCPIIGFMAIKLFEHLTGK